jgi:hypothetical protein
MITIDEKTTLQDILNNIYKLRGSKFNEEEFWTHYLANLSVLLESLSLFSFDKEKIISSFKNENNEEYFQIACEHLDRVKKNGFAFDPLHNREQNDVLFTFELKGANDKYISIILNKNNGNEFKNKIVKIQLISDVYSSYLQNTDANIPQIQKSQALELQEQEIILEIISNLLKQKDFTSASMELVNSLSNYFNCSSVSFGWVSNKYVKTTAISHIEKFKPNSDAIDLLESVFEEAKTQEEDIIYPTSNKHTIVNANKHYTKTKVLSQSVTLLIRDEDKVLGAFVFEKVKGEFSQKELVLLRLLCNNITVILQNLYYKSLNTFQKMVYKTKEFTQWFFGVEDSLKKIIIVFISFLLFFLFFVKLDYEVEASSALTTDNVNIVTAPYESRVESVNLHSGDAVIKDQVLLVLDTNELELKYIESKALIERFRAEAQKAQATSRLADMNVAKAKVNQEIAKLKKTKYYLEQSKIKSPIDGILVEGEKDNLLGSPLSKGDMVFKIAQNSDLYLTIQIDERDIDDIEVGQKGRFISLSRPDDIFIFEIQKVIPIANVNGEQKNSFTIKAKLADQTPSWFRPGMSGVSKVYIEKRRVIWILTHNMMDFLRIHLWF